MENDQFGDVYLQDSVGPEALGDWGNTICLEAIHPSWLSEQGDWKMRG
jgi:hypothetical protein